jgi:ubiquinone/menaquinone biosynthesis C-methylase UbiE
LVRRRPSVERFFAQHAEGYSRSQSHAHGADLEALLKALAPKKTETALDVATGTGFTAAALSPFVKHVIGIDRTDEMLAKAREFARGKGLANVTFETGDALELKYPDASFDILTTRRATHHFEDVPRFLLEAKRVLARKGRLGIVDMSPPKGAERFMNRIEKLRDGSHVEAFTPEAWKSMLLQSGLRILSSQILDEHIQFERWLYPVEPGGKEEAAVRSAWSHASLQSKLLLKADSARGAVRAWTKSRLVLVASKTS